MDEGLKTVEMIEEQDLPFQDEERESMQQNFVEDVNQNEHKEELQSDSGDHAHVSNDVDEMGQKLWNMYTCYAQHNYSVNIFTDEEKKELKSMNKWFEILEQADEEPVPAILLEKFPAMAKHYASFISNLKYVIFNFPFTKKQLTTNLALCKSYYRSLQKQKNQEPWKKYSKELEKLDKSFKFLSDKILSIAIESKVDLSIKPRYK